MTFAELKRRAYTAVIPAVTAVLRPLGLREPVLRGRKAFSRARRRRLEAKGSDRLSRPALHGMDAKIDAAIDADSGFFVEAGANDGFTQSNTYWLERFRGWRGILVEPMPTYFEECQAERPDATIVQAALMPEETEGQTVRMEFGELMSKVHSPGTDNAAERALVEPGLAVGWRDGYTADVPVRTLSSILDEHRAPEVDLLSLDVEGFEPQALRGLDLDRHAPRWIAIEVREGQAEVEAVLGDRYVLDRQLSQQDVLYRRRDIV